MRVLITAGPTREWMDPVRFLSNPSSGAMGIEIARALRLKGASVTLVLGPTHLPTPSKVRIVRVETALDMFKAVKSHLSTADVFVASAAVGDWRFSKISSVKLKKGKSSSMTARLDKNPDILAWAGGEKRKRSAPLFIVGFALETERAQSNAQKKLEEKNLNLIVANNPSSFAANEIDAIWIEKNKLPKNLGRSKKKALAARLALWLDKKWKTKTSL